MKQFNSDIRRERFESEIRMSELISINKQAKEREKRIKSGDYEGQQKKLYFCGNCHRIFEERSRHCPICNTKTMFEMVKRKR